MKAVRHFDTAPELRLRQRLWKLGLRYRTHYRTANTRIDFAFLGPRVAVFVDGCFWHGCPEHYVAPLNNATFWRQKLRRNAARDSYVTKRLQADGWIVIRVWECDIKSRLDTVATGIRQTVAHRLAHCHRRVQCPTQ